MGVTIKPTVGTKPSRAMTITPKTDEKLTRAEGGLGKGDGAPDYFSGGRSYRDKP